MLVITGGHAFKAEPFFKMFQDNPEITYVAAEQAKSAEAYDREDLFSYNVVVPYDAPMNITDAQKVRFLALFDKGIGVVIVHHAYLSYPMWSDYGRIAGGQYIYQDEQLKDGVTSSHYKGDVDIPVTIAAMDHPVTAGLEKKSRVVGMIIGHGPTAYENPNFLKLLAQSIRWAAQL